MAKYIDGFLIPIKKENVEHYTQIAQTACEIWKRHGALEYIEAVGDDLEQGRMISFKKSAGTKDGETVIFAFIVFESKEERDRINALVMEDETMKKMMNEMMKPGAEVPFDFTRMAYGGFENLVTF